MNGVPQTDRKTIAVAAAGQYCQCRISQLHALRQRQRTSMYGMKTVSVDVTGQAAGTADAGDNDHFMRGAAEIAKRPLNRRLHREIAASWAPVLFHIQLKISCRAHFSTSLHPAATSTGRNGLPSNFRTACSGCASRQCVWTSCAN